MGKLSNEITPKQLQDIDELQKKDIKKPLTAIQKNKLDGLLLKKNATPELSETAKTYCKQWIKEQLYGKRKDIKSKYLDKGILAEDDAISLVIDVEGLNYNEKNEEYFRNEFMTGTPDIIYPDLIIDTKCSYDCFTFPLFDTEINNKDYYYQLQGYMQLTGAREAMLSYCLVDMSLSMIEKEAYYESKNAGFRTTQEDIFDKVMEKRTYSNIDKKYRVKSFRFDYDKGVINKIEYRVKLCREYIKTLTEGMP
jgi:hypothetical protein